MTDAVPGHINLAFGLKPSPEPPALRFGAYLQEHKLPAIPAAFGHYNVFSRSKWAWGVLKNAGEGALGDCAVAGAMHCSMLWNKIHGINVYFTDLDAQDDYSAISGYVPGNASTDTGLTIVEQAKYWQKTGFRDDRDTRHRIAAYMTVDPANFDHIYAAAYLFDCVGLAITVPSSASYQFFNNQPWHNTHSTVVGMHYVPLVGRLKNGNAVVVTWGSYQEVEQSWLATNVKEVVAMVSEEALMNGLSSEGFSLEALEDDLDAISA